MIRLIFILLLGLLPAGWMAANAETIDSTRMRPALLVIDIQNEFLPMVPDREKEIALYMINGMIDMFREKGFPVIRIYHTTPGEGPKEGTPAFEFPETVKVLSSDPRVVKNYGNSFNKTDLEKILRAKGCNTLFMVGLSSVGCVLATYMGARDHDFEPFLIKDAIMSHNSDYTNQIEDIFGAIDYRVVDLLLRNAAK